MKRFISALALCISLLVLLSLFLFNPVKAKENVLLTLLNLPAPPPPNPLVSTQSLNRDEKFFNKNTPPKDNAPIEELLDYWARQSNSYQDLRYNPEPSDASRSRIVKEIGKNPKLVLDYLNLFRNDAKGAEMIKEIYDREGTGGVFAKEERKMIKEWLTYNSPYFSSDLARSAADVSDTGEYVTNKDDLLSLVRVDFDRARPIIDRLAGDSSLKTSRVLAKWALYRHALDTGSTGDIESYRDDLKAFVEDKSALPGMRDLAMDALTSEKEWPGRDDWYFSLLGDETLAELKVNGQTNTGLTTLILVSPDDKYIDKMIELAGSSNAAVRSAAVRNLVVQLNSGNPAVVKALLPWLEDQKWAADIEDSRATLVRKLSEIVQPESVPGLIKIIDERHVLTAPNYMANANMANTSYRPSNTAVNRPANTVSGPVQYYYPYRLPAVPALAKQKDPSAVAPLRRILPEANLYERDAIVNAILACGGYSLAEQLDALETAAKGVREEMDNEGMAANMAANAAASAANYAATYANEGQVDIKRPPTAAELKKILGQQILQSPEISDLLARAMVDRIEALDKQNPQMAAAYRRMILHWQNSAINILLLRDVKRGIADADTIIRLLGQRKTLREQQSTDIYDIRSGKPAAYGISACLLENTADYDSILETGNAEMKTALFACARLLRLPLPVAKVAESFKSTDTMLQIAAERYLESEDSPEARSIVLARHPNEARILGARSAFTVDGLVETYNEYLYTVYQSLGDNSLYNGWSGSGNDYLILDMEKDLQAEVKKADDLLGVYAYDGNYIRIYKDRVMFSWDEDTSRYRERPLNKEEFDDIKSYLATNRVDELPPFLSCGGAYCTAKELIMLSRQGGRRVYVTGADYPGSNARAFEFFTGLEKYFEGLKQTPAKLKYRLSREIPGLEIVLATENMSAAAVWKDGDDLRVAASENAVREKVKKEIDGDDAAEEPPVDDYSEGAEAKRAALREKRRYEGYAWYKIANGELAGITSQPPQFEFLPMRDGLGVDPGDEQWKARTADIEIRTSEDGIFKVVRGKLTKLRSGDYSHAVITPNGRWVLASKLDNENGNNVVRIDLTTNKESFVQIEGFGENNPSVYIPLINRVLVVRNDYRYYRDDGDDTTPPDAVPEGMILVDPATGVVQPIPGEVRPLVQQSYRALQKTSKAGEYWAAMMDEEKGSTNIGIYDGKTFNFKTILNVPKIKFNSMNMWVDEPGKKIYFIYRGHLLSLPLP